MENQNTRLVNLRDPKKNRKNSTQSSLLTRFTYRKQSSTRNRAVYNAILRRTSPQKRHCTLFPPPRHRPSHCKRWSSITSISLPPRIDRWKNLFISATFRNSENPISDKKLVPSDRKGASAPSSLGETKTRQSSLFERMFRLPNVTTWMMDDTLIVRIYAPRPTILVRIGWTRIERYEKNIVGSRVSLFSFFFWSPF